MNQTAAVKEFSRFAHTYDTYNIIQDEVAQVLVDLLPEAYYETVVDMGSGSGAVYKYMLKKEIDTLRFIALDASAEMLALHPNHPNIKKIRADFNTENAFCLDLSNESIILSASALQWSKDLDFTFSRLASKASKAYFAIFTSGTFKTLHETSGVHSPIYSAEVLKNTIDKYYSAEYDIKSYTLKFISVKEMFRYIKRSGVGGGEKQLGYKETKHLMEKYPLDYLEFEVLFVRAKSLTYAD